MVVPDKLTEMITMMQDRRPRTRREIADRLGITETDVRQMFAPQLETGKVKKTYHAAARLTIYQWVER